MKKPAIGLLLGIAFFSVNTFAFTQTETKTDIQSDIANVLTQQYNNTVKDCGDAKSPAFLCSGILIRGIRGRAFDFWSVSPPSKKNGGVSFSYLRKDAKFKHLYDSRRGFIVFPEQMIPKDDVKIPVLCSYAADGYTWRRDGNNCGLFLPVEKNPNKNRSCQDLNIFTAEQLKNVISRKGIHLSCAFDVRPEAPNPADAFYQTLLTMHKLIPRLQYNEIMLKPWDDTKPDTLPIEALFTINGLELDLAQLDQKDYKQKTGKFVPIVRIKLPQTPQEDAVFTYEPKDQVVSQ